MNLSLSHPTANPTLSPIGSPLKLCQTGIYSPYLLLPPWTKTSSSHPYHCSSLHPPKASGCPQTSHPCAPDHLEVGSGSGVTPLLCSEPSSGSQCCRFLLQPRPYLICYLSDLDFYSSPPCLLDSTHHDGLRLIPPTSQSFSASGPLHLLTSLPGMFLPPGSPSPPPSVQSNATFSMGSSLTTLIKIPLPTPHTPPLPCLDFSPWHLSPLIQYNDLCYFCLFPSTIM